MIKNRVIQLIDNKGIGKEKFFNSIGVTSANFRGSLLKSSLSSTTIEKIIAEIPEVNLDWLLTGRGEMIRGEEPKEAPQDIKNLSETVKNLSETINRQSKIIETLTSK